MLSPEDSGYGSTIRASRAASRRELLKSKQVRTTAMLPDTEEEVARGTTGRLQPPSVQHLREENLQLRKELGGLQEQLETYQRSLDLLDGEIETIHHAHQQEIEQYQQHLRDMMEERNQMQETNQHLENQYRELYHSFQDSVEEEAGKLIKEASQTLILSPEHTPPLLTDVVKTVELQSRQTEDLRIAELSALVRQAQHNFGQLEMEAMREHSTVMAERENLYHLRESIVAQGKERYKIERERLRVRWTAGLTIVSMSLFALMVILEVIFESLHFPFALTLFISLGICMVLSYVLAHLYLTGRINVEARGHQGKKAVAKSPK